jgi:hypothetical protein
MSFSWSKMRGWLPWILWGGLTVLAFCFAARYGVDLPRGDDWKNMAQALGRQPISLSWLWTPTNEHRFPIARLLFASVCRMAGGDTRAGMFFNAAAISGMAAAFLLLSRRMAGRQQLLDLAIPLLFLGLGMYVQYTRCIQIHFVSATLLVSLATIAVLCTSATPSWLQLSLAGLLLLALPLDGTTSLVFLPPLVLWFLVLCLSGLRRFRLLFAGVTVVLLTLLTWAYLQGMPAGRAAIQSLAAVAHGGLQFAARPWGPAIDSFEVVAGALTCIVLLLAPAIGIYLYRRGQWPLHRAVGVAALTGGNFLLIVAVAVGRGQQGLETVNPDRYAILLVPGLALTFITLLAWPTRTSFALRLLLCAIAAGLFIPNARVAIEQGRLQRSQCQAVEVDLQAGMPLPAVATRHANLVNGTDARMVVTYLSWLAEARSGPFRNPVVPQPAGDPLASFVIRPARADALEFTCDPADRVVGVRIRCGAKGDGEKAGRVTVSWEAAEASPAYYDRQVRFGSRRKILENDELLVIPMEVMTRVKIVPSPGTVLRVDGIDLLCAR